MQPALLARHQGPESPEGASVVTTGPIIWASRTMLQPAGRQFNQWTLSSGVLTPPPQAAITAGFTTLTFGPLLNVGSNPAASPLVGNWQLFDFFGTDITQTSYTQNADGSVTLAGNNAGFGNNLCTAVLRSSPSPYIDGIAFGGGGYFEATISLHATPPSTVGGSFWANDIESMAGGSVGDLTLRHWPGQASDYGDWIEVDGIEWNTGTNNTFGIAMHNWYSNVSNTQVQTGGAGGYPGFVSPVTVPGGTDFTQSHRYGYLWIPATATTQGSLTWYFDGQPIGTTVNWNQYNASLAPPPVQGTSAYSVLDTRHIAPILGNGDTTNPITIHQVVVYQRSTANNIGTSTTGAVSAALNGKVQAGTGNSQALVYHNHTLFMEDNLSDWHYYNTTTSDATPGQPGLVTFQLLGPISLSTLNYSAGLTAGSVVATISVPMKPNAAGDTFGGVFGGSLTIGGTDRASFATSGMNLTVASGHSLSNTQYNITITANVPVGSFNIGNQLGPTAFQLSQTAQNESVEAFSVTTVGPIVFASQTMLVASSGPFNQFAITAGNQVTFNGNPTSSANVVALVYHNHTAFQENSSGNWWYWNTSTSDMNPGTQGWVFFNLLGPISLSSQTYTQGAVAGTVIGQISVPMSSNVAGDTFPGVWNGTITVGGPDGAGGTGTFTTSGMNLVVAAGHTLNNPTYNITLTAQVAVGSFNVGQQLGPTAFPLTAQAESQAGTDVTTTTASINASPTAGSAGSGNIITITSGAQVAVNGQTATGTANVAELYYIDHSAFQRNTANNWFGPITSITSTGSTALTTPKPTIILSNNTFTSGNNATVGTITVTTGLPSGTIGTGAYTWALSLSGTNASSFQIVGNTLETNGSIAATTYSINIIATNAAVIGSPFTLSNVTITGTASAAIGPKNFSLNGSGANLPSQTAAQGIPVGAMRLWDFSQGHWAEEETALNTFNWSTANSSFSAAAAAGFDVAWSNGYTPTWENGGPGDAFPNPTPPSNNQHYFDMITSLISTAAGRLKYLEVWNEVNDSNSYFNGTMTQLHTLAANVASQCRAAGIIPLTPSCTSPIAGSLGGCQYMVQYLVSGGAASADAGAFHLYPHDYPDATSGNNGHGLPEQVLQQAYWWLGCMDAGGLTGKPVLVTEGGFWTTGTFGLVQQATNQVAWGALWPMLPLVAGCQSTAFYAWTNAGTAFLFTGSALNSIGVAYKTMLNFLNGGTWTSKLNRVFGTNAITNPSGSGVGNGTTNSGSPTGWAVQTNNANVSYTWQGTGTQNGMNYVKVRVFTTAATTASSGAQIFLGPVAAATNNQWWFAECFIALDPATSMTNGIVNGINGSSSNSAISDGMRLSIQNQSGSTIANQSIFQCACSIDKGKKIIWGITGASGVTGVQPYINILYGSGATFDVTLRIGVGTTPGTDGAPTCDTGTVWSADISKAGGFQGRVRWDTAGGPTSYTPGAPFTFQTNLAGTKSSVSGAVTLTNQPLLLSNQ